MVVLGHTVCENLGPERRFPAFPTLDDSKVLKLANGEIGPPIEMSDCRGIASLQLGRGDREHQFYI